MDAVDDARQAKDATKRKTKEAAKEVKPWVKVLARIGFAAKGVVYMIIGALAVEAAWGAGSSDVKTRDALVQIITQPFGQILLGLTAFGLFCYAMWRFVQAAVDPDNNGADAKGIIKRTAYVFSGIIYSGVAVAAVQLILGTRSGGGGGSSAPEDWTARILAEPFGRWLVMIIGGITICFGLYEFYRAYTAKFKEKFKLSEMSRQEKAWATRAGRAGQVARGIVHGLMGIFFIQASLQFSAQKAGGMGEALQTLASQPYGPWLLGAVAIGLFCYGIHCLVLARYRRIYMV
ncbi:MAG: DUF1206 domain-containing protein [Thermodesulfobacteriota bacterium]